MNLRNTILLMSGFGVVSDAILIAYYPQFFQIRYGLTSSLHVGAYIAAISIAVMCMLPVWARVARRIETMHLLLYTQGLAAAFCLAAIWAPSAPWYWLLTLLMFMTKASYLLMFPYLMRLEHPDNHSLVIGALSVVIHIGAIFGAAVGGPLLLQVGPTACLLLMAGGDLAQMALCAYLIRRGKVVRVLSAEEKSGAVRTPRRSRAQLSALLKLCLLMFLFDFSAYLIRPFFTLYWEQSTGLYQPLLTGLVFAIPGIMALLALWLKRVLATPPYWLDHTLGNLMLGAVGLALQGSESLWLIILGRCLYGWALYQVVVKLEVTLFKVSSPEVYARDFGVTNFFQNLGVLLSSFSAGALVGVIGVPMTFMIAASGLLLTAIIDAGWFGVDRRHRHRQGALCHAD